MSKSNIALAVLAGVVIGGAVALILKAQSELEEATSSEDTDENAGSGGFEMIAKQFSERISSELKTAEEKLKSAVKKSGHIIPDGEFGVFL